MGIYAVLAVMLEFIIFYMLDNGLLEWLLGQSGCRDTDIDIAWDSCRMFKESDK